MQLCPTVPHKKKQGEACLLFGSGQLEISYLRDYTDNLFCVLSLEEDATNREKTSLAKEVYAM